MTGTTITDVVAWEALDSRGRPTVGCRIGLAGGASGRAIVPSGASTGGHEARELRDADPGRYDGYGVRDAVASVTGTLAPLVTGLDAADQEAADAALESADDDPLLGTAGANAVLAVSLATLLAAAAASGRPLWQHVSADDTAPLLPLPMVNIVSGGAHAGRALDIQDVLAVPVGAGSFAEALEWAARVRAAAAELLARRGGTTTALVADEGGLAGGLTDNESALALVTDAVEHAGLIPGDDVALAVDLAANQLYDGAGYRLERDGVTLTPSAWRGLLEQWCRDYPVVSLEDVLAEDDWAGWAAATPSLGTDRQLLGDDLFATNAARLRQGIDGGVANAVLVKPNQAGTVSRARRVTELACAAGYATVISARSGDTEDSWLADLAVGWRTGQIKVGSTMRSERTAKWNRLLEIEATTPGAQFAGAAALSRSPGRR